MNKTMWAGLVVVLAIILLIIFVGTGSRDADTRDNATTTAETDLNAPFDEKELSSSAIVTFSDSGFSPSEVTISKGGTVTFVNASSRDFWPASAVHPTHEVYDGTTLSEHCTAGDVPFDACGRIGPNNSWSFTFEKEGSWGYHDHLNASHFGRVIVE